MSGATAAAAAANKNSISLEMPSTSQQATPRNTTESLPNMESIHVTYFNTVGISRIYCYVLVFLFSHRFCPLHPFPSSQFAIDLQLRGAILYLLTYGE